MTPASAIVHLLHHLTEGSPLPPETTAQLAGAIELHLNEDVPLDRAIGLKKHGGVSPSNARALNERDQLLRQLWRTSPEWRDLAPSAAARLMAISASRYETNRFPR